MERVLVAREAIQEGLLGQGGRLGHVVGVALGRRVPGLGTGLAAEAALAPDEGREAVGAERLAVLVLRLRLQYDEGTLALVVHGRHLARVLHLGPCRQGAVQDQVLFAVQQHHGVEAEALHPHQAAQHPEDGHHAEAGQHLQGRRLVGVLQLARVGRRHPGAHTQVVEDDGVLVPLGHIAG